MERDRKETSVETWRRLLEATVRDTITVQESKDPQSEEYQRAQAGLITTREEFERTFPVKPGDEMSSFRPTLFGDQVRDKIGAHYRKLRTDRLAAMARSDEYFQIPPERRRR